MLVKYNSGNNNEKWADLGLEKVASEVGFGEKSRN